MAENDNSLPGRVDLNDPRLRARRRERIQTLLGKSGRHSATQRPERGAQTGGGLEDLLRSKSLQRAYGVLTETPVDGQGTVPETPFTVAGLKKLLGTLQARADQDGQPGAKVAQGLLRLLAPSEDGEAQLEGISVAKLQRLAKFAKRGGAI